ncbi:endonuclease/exonuclease/phosphatase family protein [Leisingera daeponensis]|uniref:endonuclease/exonuclease/phosphatase family protein n=1 Tax=Leisingera daeponensis TaxID=405746 RepID=UPI000183996B|nr:endonuclease/exonuclease/phosphatase family protein [Leisingera daeponensis]EDZ46194.1 endonuclease/exonuclease/phosphatase family protein [Rhodobacterales bacterium Y4I]
MRLATYNIEWFAYLFDKNDRLVLDGKPSGVYGVDRYTQGRAIAHVLRRLDADAVMVIEAPNTGRTQRTTRALEAFAAEAGLRACEAVSGFPNDTHQEIALLYDPEVLAAEHDARASAAAPQFDGLFEIDLDVDDHLDTVAFSKPPLELAVTTRGGTRLRMIGAHLKSKAPHGASAPEEITALTIANQRKQLAQARWLHLRVADHVAAGEHVIVLGDLNDGPGADGYEKDFGQSSIEIVLGDLLNDPHAQSLLQPRATSLPSTSRFYNPDTKRYFPALLDYVMISHSLMRFDPQWRIWHPFEDAECYADEELREALLNASDHFPVTLDIALE